MFVLHLHRFGRIGSSPHAVALPVSEQSYAYQLHRKGIVVLWTIIFILMILWLVSVVAKFTLGGLIHLLLIIAFIMLIFRLVTGRRAPIG